MSGSCGPVGSVRAARDAPGAWLGRCGSGGRLRWAARHAPAFGWVGAARFGWVPWWTTRRAPRAFDWVGAAVGRAAAPMLGEAGAARFGWVPLGPARSRGLARLSRRILLHGYPPGSAGERPAGKTRTPPPT
ncbi:hypothetical protein GCM10023214_76140 [Amycolatopsis dongchuanensis]|uniref:Uncharacterized protein n=1 Tax=Amycolatopsis dongchuanensis TaxID=1070866 RepID=A0ABP8VS91_9PSEU